MTTAYAQAALEVGSTCDFSILTPALVYIRLIINQIDEEETPTRENFKTPLYPARNRVCDGLPVLVFKILQPVLHRIPSLRCISDADISSIH